MSNDFFAAQMDNPEHVGRAIGILQDRIAKLESDNAAVSYLLLSLFLAIGTNRHSPFVTHSEIEAALLAMRNTAAGGAYGEGAKNLVEALLSVYRGDYGQDVDAPARHLRLVRDAEPPADPATGGP